MSSDTLLIGFPGNPGHPDDMQSLLQALSLPPSVTTVLITPNAPKSLHDALNGIDCQLSMKQEGRLVGIAYSFGCYLALQWAQTRQHRFDELILLNPTLAPTSRVSFFARTLACTPFLGSFVLAKMAPKMTDSFISKTFAPHAPSEATAEGLRRILNDGATWKRALGLKLMQQRHPLKADVSNTAQRFTVIRGEQDMAVNWSAQESVLATIGISTCLKSSDHLLHTVKGAGHSLLWTHLNECVELIRPKITRLSS